MIQYLEYLKRIFFTTGTKYIGIILSELTLYPHTYQEILIAFYQPLEYDMILDGRHRYIEAEAFSLNKKLPVIHLHSDEIISALVDLNSFLNYIIVRNIKVFYDCVFGGKSMRPLLQFSDFGVYI